MQTHYQVDDKTIKCETIVERTFNLDGSVHAQVSTTIDGKFYTAQSYASTEDAIIKLQNELPKNIKIICCQSCIHGNFCVTGDYDDEIFCLSDFEPKLIDDILHVTENKEEREKRSRNLLYCCKQYKQITNDMYSYNDWKHLTNC
jgi:hypothetical protein